MTATHLLLSDLIFFHQLLDEKLLRVLLSQKLGEKMCRKATIDLVLSLSHQSITNELLTLALPHLFLNTVIDLGCHKLKRLFC